MSSDHDRLVRLEEQVRANQREALLWREASDSSASERAEAIAKALELARDVRLSPEDEARLRVLEANQSVQQGGAKTWALVLSLVFAVVAVAGLILTFITLR